MMRRMHRTAGTGFGCWIGKCEGDLEFGFAWFVDDVDKYASRAIHLQGKKINTQYGLNLKQQQ